MFVRPASSQSVFDSAIECEAGCTRDVVRSIFHSQERRCRREVLVTNAKTRAAMFKQSEARKGHS